jgi:hypothetical protein
VDFQWVGPANTDAVQQADLLDAAITAGCDGMGISCNSAEVLLPVINRAVDAGIPVITWDSDSDQSKRLSFYSINGDEAATAGAEVFVNAMADNPNKTYALLSGNAGAPNLEGRIAAVRAVLDQPETALEYLVTLFCNDDPVLGQTLMEDQLTATPDLVGFFLIGGWPTFADTPDDPVPREDRGGDAEVRGLGHAVHAAPAARERHRPGPHRPEVLRLGLRRHRHHVRPRGARHRAPAVHRLLDSLTTPENETWRVAGKASSRTRAGGRVAAVRQRRPVRFTVPSPEHAPGAGRPRLYTAGH